MTKTSNVSNQSSKVKVAVRVRPFNKREIDLNTRCVVDMKDDQTFLSSPVKDSKQNEKKQIKTFAFDHCFWSMDPEEKKFSDQEHVFQCLGLELLDNAFSGYNACIFAYGQTGSGKSYTMMGSHDQPGLIPRLCTALFQQIETETKNGQSFKVEVSYMEIYNEKVRDLLDPNGGKQQLKVREHKVLGPYVDGLQQLMASSAHDVQELMSEGSKSRTVAATKMNAESSRSHAVFTLIVTQTMTDLQSGMSGERASKLSLVDLAGSERSSKTGASGERLKEGSNINKSLTTLGLVISALADQAAGKAKNKFVPYRDSTLTWILKDNLGGNSRTTMVATLSPSADNYEETLSTLRYADRAKRIVNKAVINEDPKARMIRELREEVERLQSKLKQSESMRAPELQEKLDESEKLMWEMSQTWEEKFKKTEMVHKKRQETFEKMGISLETSGIKLEKTKCFLVNLNADPSLNELLVYYLKEKTLVGQSEESDIQLSGLGIHDRHAEMDVIEDDGRTKVTVSPLEGARTCINGRPITSSSVLRHGDRILWGNNHFFRINVPKLRKIVKRIDGTKLNASASDSDLNKSLDQSIAECTVSYEDAQQEVLLNQPDTPMHDTIMNLEREFQLLQNGSLSTSGLNNDSTLIMNLEDEERKKYETEIDALKRQLDTLTTSPNSSDVTNSMLETPASVVSSSLPPSYQKYRDWKDERERSFHSSVTRLREFLCRAQLLAREANELALEMKKQTEFTVTMRIPAHNLTANRKNGALLCEPAIQVVRQGKEVQIWSVEKLSNRLVDMRDLYESFTQDQTQYTDPLQTRAMNLPSDEVLYDPFNDNENRQSLVGVANVFLSCLLQDAPLRYPLPIISQQGQVVGKLLVELQAISGFIPERMLLGRDESEAENIDNKQIAEKSSSLSLDLEDVSASSGSSGVGSSLSTDPLATANPPDTIKIINNKRTLNASNSFISSASVPVVPNVEVENFRRKVLPQLACRISIIEALGLPISLSPYVECQFEMYNHDPIVIPPQLTPDQVSPKRSSTLNIRYNFSQIFNFEITDELVDHLTSNASLAIEVWGHRNPYHQNHHVRRPHLNSTTRSSLRNKHLRGCSLLKEKSLSLKERWDEVVKRLKLEIIVKELGDSGEYEAVEISRKPEVSSVGVFQLKQGQSRRVQAVVSPVQDSGTLPLICDSIAAVYAGSITSSSNAASDLDSYQENDLDNLRVELLRTLENRKNHLQKQINNLTNKQNKTEVEKEREGRLFDQWLMMTEERNAVLAPAVDSGVPGAPASWSPPPSCELHVPIIFLDLNSQPVECEDLIREPAGLDSELIQEIPGTFVQLPFVRSIKSDYLGQVTALASWDSSIHDSLLLNRVTPPSDRIHVIIKVHVHLSHPVEMDLVLRKRICLSVYKQKGFTSSLRRKIQSNSTLSSSGVVYEIIANVPLATSDGEDHEALAMIAASGANQNGSLDESLENLSEEEDELSSKDDNSGCHFEKFVMQATKSVDNILALDRIRQEVSLRNTLLERSSRGLESGLEVMSIISKKNKNYASSIYSGYSAHRSAEDKLTDVS